MTETSALKIGVISDTHGYLDPQIFEVFEGVDHILHAGDIGWPSLILELEGIAPVTAVKGNTDELAEYKEIEIVELGSRKFLLHHVFDVKNPDEKVKKRIIRENPDMVIFGHSHKRFFEMIGETLYLNPGYAGKQRFELPRSVAVLTCDSSGVTADFIDL